MAEAAGLTLGTVALASLFTTCIECIEYFELSKSYEYDYGLACLKLSLLKSRLDNWWYATGLCSNDHEGRPPSTGWPRKRDVIQTSLQGIVDIISNAELLRDKYRLLPRKSRKINGCLWRGAQKQAASVISDSRPRSSDSSPGKSFLRRSTTWAIRQAEI